MAYIDDQFCSECNQQRVHMNGVCVECDAKRRRNEKVRWDNLTLEQKVEELKRRIESKGL